MLVQKEIKIKNKLGLHARAAAQFVKTANRYLSEIKVGKDQVTANGKSIMGVLTLAASMGSLIRISCDGPDANEAMEALETLVYQKFNEE